jgi:hypothetical protein
MPIRGENRLAHERKRYDSSGRRARGRPHTLFVSVRPLPRIYKNTRIDCNRRKKKGGGKGGEGGRAGGGGGHALGGVGEYI